MNTQTKATRKTPTTHLRLASVAACCFRCTRLTTVLQNGTITSNQSSVAKFILTAKFCGLGRALAARAEEIYSGQTELLANVG